MKDLSNYHLMSFYRAMQTLDNSIAAGDIAELTEFDVAVNALQQPVPAPAPQMAVGKPQQRVAQAPKLNPSMRAKGYFANLPWAGAGSENTQPIDYSELDVPTLMDTVEPAAVGIGASAVAYFGALPWGNKRSTGTSPDGQSRENGSFADMANQQAIASSRKDLH